MDIYVYIYMDGMGYVSWVPEPFGPLLKGSGFTNSYPLADLFLRGISIFILRLQAASDGWDTLFHVDFLQNKKCKHGGI